MATPTTKMNSGRIRSLTWTASPQEEYCNWSYSVCAQDWSIAANSALRNPA